MVTKITKMTEEYKLTIKTSDRFEYAGTIATVCVQIVGLEGNSTDFHTLDYFFRNDFQAGSTETYTVQHSEEQGVVGAPLMLHFKLKGLKADAWLCDDIEVGYNGFEYSFPVYDWLEDELVVMRGAAQLPQTVTNDRVAEARRAEVHRNLLKYRWQKKATDEQELGWGMPRFIDSSVDLPRPLEETKSKLKQQRANNWKTRLNEIRNRLRGLFQSLISPADYKALYRRIDVSDPPFIINWRRDEELGRQALNGVSPLDIERCTELPDCCEICGEIVDPLLPEGSTLESEMKAGRIYIADFTGAREVDRNVNPRGEDGAGFYEHANCLCLFHANRDGRFMPLAVQLAMWEQESVFTPADSDYDWLLAKMYMRCSSQSYHQWKHRYLHTNAVSETFAVATMRNPAQCHPVYKLLRPHLRTVAHVNREAREEVIALDSDINKSVSLNTLSMIRHSYKSFTLDDLNIPKVLAKRGLMDRDLLPNFHYRDDAIDLWREVEVYVSDVLRCFYECDESVKEDFELQAWTRDVALEGFGWQDGNTRGAPEEIVSRDQLIELCTLIVFASSVQHSLLNNGQMETYQFVPNAPCCMRLPVHSRGQGTLERIMDTLPDLKASNTMISFSYGLSQFAKDEVFLGETLEKMFVEAKVVKIQEEFKERLEKLERKFEERNKSLQMPYTSSLPSAIPRSIVN